MQLGGISEIDGKVPQLAPLKTAKFYFTPHPWGVFTPFLIKSAEVLPGAHEVLLHHFEEISEISYNSVWGKKSGNWPLGYTYYVGGNHLLPVRVEPGRKYCFELRRTGLFVEFNFVDKMETPITLISNNFELELFAVAWTPSTLNPEATPPALRK